MRVLHVLASNKYSGAENVACEIIDALNNDGVEAAYCSPDGEIGDMLRERGIRFIPLKKLSKKQLKIAIRNFQPDILHAHDMRAGFVATQACGKIPMISHIHNNAFGSRGISLKSIAYLKAARKAKHIFWVSESSFDGYIFHKFFAKKSSVLRNVIDVAALYEKMRLDEKEYGFDAVFVGRLTYPKNPQRLMKIWKEVVKINPEMKLAVVGTGDLESVTKGLAEEYGISENVSFFGFVTNPLKIMYDSKVLVMTSRWEGTPMCALEAMALGVPVVSTPVDGLKILIKNGENGYLEEEDEKIAERLAEISEDATLRQRLSEKQSELSKQFNDMKKYAQTVLQTYKSCMAQSDEVKSECGKNQ